MREHTDRKRHQHIREKLKRTDGMRPIRRPGERAIDAHRLLAAPFFLAVRLVGIKWIVGMADLGSEIVQSFLSPAEISRKEVLR